MVKALVRGQVVPLGLIERCRVGLFQVVGKRLVRFEESLLVHPRLGGVAVKRRDVGYLGVHRVVVMALGGIHPGVVVGVVSVGFARKKPCEGVGFRVAGKERFKFLPFVDYRVGVRPCEEIVELSGQIGKCGLGGESRQVLVRTPADPPTAW